MPGNYTRVYVPSDGDVVTAAGYNGELDLIRTNWTPTGLDDISGSVADMQTTVDPGEVGSESLATDLAGELHRLRFMIKEITGKDEWYESPSASLVNVCPVGTIIPFYDFNATVTFDNTIWAYCDGSVINNAGSPLNGLTLPDLSNRYLVGYGTEAGGDIDTATWNATAVGNAGHTINVQHTHTDSGHTHSITSHTHGPGTLQFKVSDWDGSTVNFYDSGGTQIPVFTETVDTSAGAGTITGALLPASGVGDGYTKNGTGVTSGTSGNTGSTAVSLSNSLSTTQSIQPRSIRCRYIIRYI